MEKISVVLKKSGRLDQILDELRAIINKVDGAYSVTYSCKNHTITSEDIKKEAKLLLYAISANKVEEITSEDIENLFIWYHNRNEGLLHNYANDLTHRKKPGTSLEYLRVSQIISNLLINIYYNTLFAESDEDEIGYYVPEGWKRKKGE